MRDRATTSLKTANCLLSAYLNCSNRFNSSRCLGALSGFTLVVVLLECFLAVQKQTLELGQGHWEYQILL
jgi:hypothetical protein